MTGPLIIKNISVTEDALSRKISGNVGEDIIWFKVPLQFPLQRRAEPFIAVALLEAMYTGEAIEVDEAVPVSQQFFETLPELQAVYHCWNNKLKIINVKATLHSERHSSGKVGSFFSSGVDSSHTLCRHMDEITHLVLMDAFDDPILQDEWQRYVQQQQTYAEKLGKELIPVQSNVRQYAENKKISWEFLHGLILSTTGKFFGFDKVYIPSSYTYSELFAWGSHPLTDPMWSTESMCVVHDGAGDRRWEKVRNLTKDQVMLDNLHVCWRSKVDNCGQCPKCSRTMLALHLLGHHSKSIPEYRDIGLLKKLRARDAHDAAFLEDAMLMARSVGDEAVCRKLYWYLKQYQWLQFFECADKLLLGSVARKTYRRLKKSAWLDYRVILESRD